MTTMSPVPAHSVIHATNYVDPAEASHEHINGGVDVEADVKLASSDKASSGEHVSTSKSKSKKKAQSPKEDMTEEEKHAAELALMRRRLTVTGASDTIDGVARMSVEEKDKALQYERAKAERCAVSEYSGVSKKGHAPYNPRKKNQDALIMAEDPTTNTLVLCVLDGHGEHGDGVSYHVRDFLPTELFNHPAWATDVKQASRDAILAVEDQIARNFRIDTEFSGTTLAMAIIRGNTITGVNIGDSRVLIATQDEQTGALVPDPLTNDHKPDSPLEQERIIAAGGRVFAVEYDDGVDGPARVWLGHMDVPGLAMSRSLGDAVAHMAGVISEPEFTERELDAAKDKFVIVATDGLWEFMDNECCIEFASKMRGPSESVDGLVKEANRRWMAEEQVIDDTTVVVAHLFDYQGGN